MGTHNAKYVVELQEANTEMFVPRSSFQACPSTLPGWSCNLPVFKILQKCFKQLLLIIIIETVLSKLSVYVWERVCKLFLKKK